MTRIFFVVLACAFLMGGCRRRSRPVNPVAEPTAPAEPVTSAPTAAEVPAPAAVSAPAVAVDGQVTVEMESRFKPAQVTDQYVPAPPGDYQTHLNSYNRVLANWCLNSGYTPDSLEGLLRSYGTPKPPQPPTGRKLVYDPKTITVRLQ